MSEKQVAALLTFLDGIRKSPRRTGAIFPSGPVLAKEMAAAVDLSVPGTILELGPGTGVFTEALLARGLPPERLLLIEFNADFCKFLRQRFPRLRLIEGSAFELAEIALREKIDTLSHVVSGLPLLNFPVSQRLDLVHTALELMHPDGAFVQFTYGAQSSVPASQLQGSVSTGKRVWRNFPPATIWLYRREAEFTARERLAETAA